MDISSFIEFIERVEVDLEIWRIAEPYITGHLNRRLKAHDFMTSRFRAGNFIERLLGKEIAFVAYALENAKAEEVLNAVTNWSKYRPEELWYLSQKIEASGPNGGWRRSIHTILLD